MRDTVEREAPAARRGPAWLGRLWREPLVRFLLIGAVLFLTMSAVKALQRPVVRIDAAELEQLAAYWEAQYQRPPNKAELAGIIQERIDEELLARDALRLGLDKDDMIIRRRLAQKMGFASEDAAREPTEADLRAYYAKTADRYAAPAKVSFQQVFFSGDRPKGGAERAAAQALERAEEGGREDPTGDPFVFPLAYEDANLPDLVRDYGAAFVKLLSTAPVGGGWQGPVISPYGWHLVKVTARRQGASTSFEAVRDQVRDGYLADRRDADRAAFLKRLREKYRVVVAGVDK